MDIEEKLKERSAVIFYDARNQRFTLDEFSGEERHAEFFIEQHRKVHVERMTGEHPHIRAAIQQLITLAPDLANASLRFDNNPKITLSEFLEEGLGDTILYHGTSAALLGRIAREGLTPRRGREAHNFTERSGESLNDRVYFSSLSCLGHARFAAESAAKKHGGPPVILQVSLSRLPVSDLVPDEDSKAEAWHDSLSRLGACAYRGTVPPDSICLADNHAQPDAFLNHPSKEGIAMAFNNKRDLPFPINEQHKSLEP